ncbi:DNA damage-inducible protein 1 [Linderina macrospora]|uniref:DNA damage-inducible protein 1 n=1 Tax=Linderina macrospora TaxID=4868 RepID=A0ACC1JGB2_9FUNG|nr:DNA damage-inducible protein 1 [Linderina macrospora]
MRLTITLHPSTTFSIEVDDSMELENLSALLEMEAMQNQLLLHNGKALTDPKASLKDLGLQNDDMVYLLDSTKQRAAAPSSAPAVAGPAAGISPQMEALRQRLLNDPALLRQVSQGQPEIEQAARSNPAEFARLVGQLEAQRQQAEEQRQREIEQLNADPFNIEAQRRIEEAIRQENVARNMELAMEHNPESFAQVTMLYINVEVNGTPVKAFVDSGAQATIMSPDCAERCGIMRLLDTRFAGIARGVGQAKILGRVHNAQMKVGSQVLLCSFTVMEGKHVDLLFGLDMLKRHQACIDLKNNALVIGDESIRFLPEHELPKMTEIDDAELAGQNTVPVAPPGGMAAAPAAPVASSSSVAQPAQTAQTDQTAQIKYPEEMVQTIMSFGVTREQAISALDAADGNPDVAASFLFP